MTRKAINQRGRDFVALSRSDAVPQSRSSLEHLLHRLHCTIVDLPSLAVQACYAFCAVAIDIPGRSSRLAQFAFPYPPNSPCESVSRELASHLCSTHVAFQSAFIPYKSTSSPLSFSPCPPLVCISCHNHTPHLLLPPYLLRRSCSSVVPSHKERVSAIEQAKQPQRSRGHSKTSIEQVD